LKALDKEDKQVHTGYWHSEHTGSYVETITIIVEYMVEWDNSVFRQLHGGGAFYPELGCETDFPNNKEDNKS
jgi:hypothetical protein